MAQNFQLGTFGQYITTNVSSNTITFNNSNIIVSGTSLSINIGNSAVNTIINSSAFSGTANNASYLGGTVASGYQTTAGLSANVATLASNSATYLGASGNFGNSSGIYTSDTINATSFTTTTFIANNSITRSAPTLAIVGGGATSEGGQIVLGYGNNLATTITGQSNYTFNIDVTGGNTGTTPLLRIFAQHGDATTTAILNAANTGRVHIGSTAEQTDSTFKVTGTANVTSDFRVGGNTTFATNTFTVGTSTYFVSNGNVGIGTSSPNSLLHLSTTGPAILTIEADTDNVTETDNARIIMKQDNGAVVGRIGYANNLNSLEIINQYADNLQLGTNNTNIMYLVSNGNVGIGTASPGYLLDVNGNMRSTGSYYINSNSPTIYFQDTDHRSAMIHCNSNLFYILRGDGANSTTWATYNGYWPTTWNLEDNSVTFGGVATAVTDFRAPLFYDSNDTSFYIDPASGSNLKGLVTVRGTGVNAAVRYYNTTGVRDYRVMQKDDARFVITDESAGAERLSLGTTGEFSIFNKLTLGPYAGSSTTGGVVGLEVKNNGGTGDSNLAAIGFHCQGTYGAHLALRADSIFGVGGWSASAWRWYINLGNGQMNAAGTVWAGGNLVADGSATYSTIYYDRNDSNWYLLPANYFKLKDNSGGYNVTFISSTSGLLVGNAENNNQTVRLGSAWQRPGIYVNGDLNLMTDSGNNIVFVNANVNKGYIDVNGTMYAYSYGYMSDRRLKKNIQPITFALDKIKMLNGKKYQWNEKANIPSENYEFGFIADEVEEVIPELVAETIMVSEDGDKYKSVTYSKLIPFLVEAMKEQQTQIENLKKEIELLKKG